MVAPFDQEMAYGSHFVPQAAAPVPAHLADSSQSQQHSDGPGIVSVLTAEQQALVNINRRCILKPKTIRGYNNKLHAIISFLEKKASENNQFITNGTIDDLVVHIDLTTVDDKAAYQMSVRPLRYREKDINYINLQKKMVELFFADPHYFTKCDKNGDVRLNNDGKPMVCGFDHRRKHCCSLKYGRKLANGLFNIELANSMADIITGLKVANAELKHKGQVEENEADEMPSALFEFMCECAMHDGNALWWAMSVLQWSLMARVQNIDDLVFRSFTMGSDTIRAKFNQTKMNQTGSKTTSKHCYANPFNVTRCLFTSLAIYFCTMNTTWSKDDPVHFIFIKKGSQTGSAFRNYCEYVKKWAKNFREKIATFIRADYTNVHGVRKGAATEAAASPETSLPSVFHRGEWSLGIVQDIYFKFAEKGDHVLGRILAGLDPDSVTFDVLPPHFINTDDEHIDQAMELWFGNILSMLGDEDTFMLPILLRCLASLVHHEQSIREVILRNPKHPWRCLPFFTNDELLSHLKSNVTTEPTKGVLEKPTGLARNTIMLQQVNELVGHFRDDKKEREREREERRSAVEDIKAAVREAIEEQALSNGHLTYASFASIIDVREKHLLGGIQTRMDEVVARIEATLTQTIPNGGVRIQNLRAPAAAIQSQNTYRQYQHTDGKMYFTPEGYELPALAQLFPAFCMWINGDSFTADTVRPFILWSSKDVPYFLWKKFRVGWFDALHHMMESPTLHELDADLSSGSYGPVPEDEMPRLFDEGRKDLLSKHSFISKLKYQKWTVTTWSKQMQFSSVIKQGTAREKALANANKTRWNRPHGTKRKRTMVQQTLFG